MSPTGTQIPFRLLAVSLVVLLATLTSLTVEDSRAAPPTDMLPTVLNPNRPATRPPSTSPSLGERESFRIAVVSDLNSAYGSMRYLETVHLATRKLIDAIQPQLVLITGDMVAGQKRGLDYAGMWDAFHRTVTNPLREAHIPVAPTPGNHDAAPDFLQERAEYVAQWTSEERALAVEFADRSGYPLYYSFHAGGVFFASVDAAAVGPLARTQIEWLDKQLSATPASTKIVFGHLPVHPVARHREREILNDGALSELLSRTGVSAYISGHHHAFYPGVVDGVRHIAMPCLGSGTRRLIGTTRTSPTALVVLEVDKGTLKAPVALRAPEFDVPIARSALPPEIRVGNHRIVRDDLADLVSAPEAGDVPRARPGAKATDGLPPPT